MTEPLVGMLRRDEQDRFEVQVRVSRPAAPGVLDVDTGQYSDAPSTIYEGSAALEPAPGQGETSQEQGGVDVAATLYLCKLPVDTAVVVDDEVEVTACVHDAGMVGAMFRVAVVHLQDRQVTRRVTLERQVR